MRIPPAAILSFSRITLVCLLLSTCILATSASAMDKRTFIQIVPPGTGALHLLLISTETETSQYQSNSQLMGKVKNDNLMTKAIARFSLLDNLELAIGVPYLLQRKQSRTNAAGITTSKFDSQGLGDADIQLTWQWRDSRKGGLGVLTGVELKVPTGDKNDGLGSDTWETSLRSVLSYKTVWGYPYGMAIYTDSGSTRVNGVRIEPADDLYLAAGFKSRFWHGFGFDLSTYRYVDTSRSVTENNGSPAIAEKHDSPGWKVYGCYRFSKSLEWNILYERISPEAHQVDLNGTTISKKIDDKERFGAIVKYFW